MKKSIEKRLTKIEGDIAELKAGQGGLSEAIAEMKGMLTIIAGLPEKVESNSEQHQPHLRRNCRNSFHCRSSYQTFY